MELRDTPGDAPHTNACFGSKAAFMNVRFRQEQPLTIPRKADIQRQAQRHRFVASAAAWVEHCSYGCASPVVLRRRRSVRPCLWTTRTCSSLGSRDQCLMLYCRKGRTSMRRMGRLIAELIASSGHFISQLKQYRHFRPHTGCPRWFFSMFFVGQMSMQRPQAVHLLGSTVNNRLYTCSTSQRLVTARSIRYMSGALGSSAVCATSPLAAC